MRYHSQNLSACLLFRQCGWTLSPGAKQRQHNGNRRSCCQQFGFRRSSGPFGLGSEVRCQKALKLFMNFKCLKNSYIFLTSFSKLGCPSCYFNDQFQNCCSSRDEVIFEKYLRLFKLLLKTHQGFPVNLFKIDA